MRRLALLACAFIGLAAIFGLGNLLVAAPYRATAERIASSQLELEGVMRRVENARRSLAAANNAAPMDVARLATTGDSATALAALQERVRRTVAAHGGQALSTVGSAAEPAGGVSRLAVGLTGRFDEAALFAFLRELEGGTPPILVDSLSVRPMPVPGQLPLDVSVTLVSFAAGRDAS